MQEFINAVDFEYEPALAAQYVAKRSADAAALLSEMTWAPGAVPGTLRCKLYKHSILWDIKGDKLHCDHTDFEVMPNGGDDIWCGTLQQVLAWLLAKHW